MGANDDYYTFLRHNFDVNCLFVLLTQWKDIKERELLTANEFGQQLYNLLHVVVDNFGIKDPSMHVAVDATGMSTRAMPARVYPSSQLNVRLEPDASVAVSGSREPSVGASRF